MRCVYTIRGRVVAASAAPRGTSSTRLAVILVRNHAQPLRYQGTKLSFYLPAGKANIVYSVDVVHVGRCPFRRLKFSVDPSWLLTVVSRVTDGI